MSVQDSYQPTQAETLCTHCNKPITSAADDVVITTFKGTTNYHRDCWLDRVEKHWDMAGEDHDTNGCSLCMEYVTSSYGETGLHQNIVKPKKSCTDCTYVQKLDIQVPMVCTKCGVEQWHTNEVACMNKCINDLCETNDLSKGRTWIKGKRSPLILLPDAYELQVGYNRPVAKPRKCKDCKGTGCIQCSGRVIMEAVEEEKLGSENILAGFSDDTMEASFDSEHSMLIVYKGYSTLIKEVVDDEVGLSEEDVVKIHQKKMQEELEFLEHGILPKRKFRITDTVWSRAIQQMHERYGNLFYNKDPSKVFMKGRVFHVNAVSAFDEEKENQYKQERAQLLLNMVKKHRRLVEKPPLDDNTKKFLQIAINQMIQNGFRIKPEIPENIDLQVAKKITWNWFNEGKIGKDNKPRNAKKSIAVSEILKLQPKSVDVIYVSKEFHVGSFQRETTNRFFHFLANDNSLQDEIDRMKVDMNEFMDFNEIELPERLKIFSNQSNPGED